jgi:3-hydroxybutyryl-CoA dehydrogenase
MKLPNVKQIGIIGTGMMATSLAVLTTGHGYKTTLLARSDERAEGCRSGFEAFYRDLIKKGLVTPEQAAICSRYLSFTKAYDDLRDADVVFECVVELADVKHAVYNKIEEYCADVKAICSVSSAIVVDELAGGASRYGDRIIVTHPFNPPHLVPLFEVVKGSMTADGVTDYAKELLISLDREVIVLKRGVPGFIGNRLQMALWREAQYIVENDIADPRDVDRAAMYSFMPRYTSIGIFEHFDNGGLDLSYKVNKYLFPHLCDAKENLEVLSQKVAEGNLGPKTGVGFYDWRGVDMDAFRERIGAPFWRFFNWDLPKE